MSITLKIDNPNLLEKQLIHFMKQKKESLEEMTIEALKGFIGTFQEKENFFYEKKDIHKNLSIISSDNTEPRDETIKLYSHVEDSAQYIHDLRRKNRY
jgi:hypothetical protein